jgi:hypothetical protein
MTDADLIQVYPIPVSTKLNVSYPSSGASTLHLYDLQGRIQALPVTILDAGHATLEVSSLSKGIYLLEVVATDTKVIKRVVIE